MLPLATRLQRSYTTSWDTIEERHTDGRLELTLLYLLHPVVTPEEFAHHALLEQPLAIGREGRVIPYRLVQRQAHESAIHHVEVDVLEQCAL